MLQGDEAWRCFANAIRGEDRIHATSYNARALAEHRLRLPLGPVPCVGPIMTAPVVLLLSHPPLDARATEGDLAFQRDGWPLPALHPDAPAAASEWWQERVSALVDRFGAQHVSNSLAAVFLTPWHSARFDTKLRLPSRKRMLELAAGVAARDAIVVLMHGEDLWTEHPDIASLPATRRVHAHSWRRTELSPSNLGDAWSAVCKLIEVHAWL